MRFNSKYKIEEATLQDKSCPVLEHVFVDIWKDQPVLVATDRRMIAVVPCEVDSIHEIGLVSKEALAAARKASRASGKGKSKDHMVSIELGVEATVRDGHATHTFSRTTEFKFPNWTPLPKLNESAKQTFRLSLNPKMLLQLAKAVGSPEGITIEVSDMGAGCNTACVKVRPYGAKDEDAFGFLMPLLEQNQ